MDAVALAHTALGRFRDDPPAIVFASGPRFANFLAARWLADAFGAKLVLQYRDEWTVLTPAFVQSSESDRAEEARCLARADLVSFVSQGKESLYRKAFPGIDPGKFVVVPNGWEPYFHERARNDTQHLVPGPFTLTYTGRWHSSLQPFLGALAGLFERQPKLLRILRIVILGRQLPQNETLLSAFAARFPRTLVSLSAVSPVTAIEIQRESGALLLLNEHIYDGVVPLKTFDYLCSSKPVLVFGRTGGAAKIIQELKAGITVAPDDGVGFETAIQRLIQGGENWNTPARRDWNARYSRTILTERMLAAMAALSAGALTPATSPNDRCQPPAAAKATV